MTYQYSWKLWLEYRRWNIQRVQFINLCYKHTISNYQFKLKTSNFKLKIVIMINNLFIPIDILVSLYFDGHIHLSCEGYVQFPNILLKCSTFFIISVTEWVYWSNNVHRTPHCARVLCSRLRSQMWICSYAAVWCVHCRVFVGVKYAHRLCEAVRRAIQQMLAHTRATHILVRATIYSWHLHDTLTCSLTCAHNTVEAIVLLFVVPAAAAAAVAANAVTANCPCKSTCKLAIVRDICVSVLVCTHAASYIVDI